MTDALFSSTELTYVVVLFLLFVVPRILQRFRLPTAVSSFGLGAAAGLGFQWFVHDPTIQLLSTLGIVALFLFAGLDVDLEELRARKAILAQHVIVRVLATGLVAWGVSLSFGLDIRPALLIGLALVTPSAGFILDSLRGLGVNEQEQFWIRSKVVATELVALAILFVTLQSTSAVNLGVSGAILIAMILFLPVLFRGFASAIVPHAPRSEFAFLIMVAVICASVTRALGVYYLVGAFVVGMAADRFRDRLPAMGSERMLHAVEAFASFFIPFYFFHAGLELRPEDFGLSSLALGGILLAVMVPFRLALVAAHRRATLKEGYRSALRVGLPMIPTLVFGLVIVGILRDRYALPPTLLGGLVIYTIGTTLLPGLIMRVSPPEYESPEVPPLKAKGSARDPNGRDPRHDPGTLPNEVPAEVS